MLCLWRYFRTAIFCQTSAKYFLRASTKKGSEFVKAQKTQNGWPLRESPKSFCPLRKNIPAHATDDDFRLSILTVF